MRTTLTLDQDVYEAAQVLARTSGCRLGKVLSELARRGLTPPAGPRRRGRARFPVFEVPPDAPVISAARVQEFLDEEGHF